MGGINWTISNDTILGGKYFNIGKFSLDSGKTITVNASVHFLEIEASEILVQGIIDANGKGELGGSGGAGGAFSNGSGNAGKGGIAGSTGAGTGGGNGGYSGGDGGFITQICGGLFCDGNRDGLNAGGGGAGGGGGGSYGGIGGIGGWGGFGTGFTGATGGQYGNGALASSLYGNITDHDITYGSGGGGAGGGGGGWNYGTVGGVGGNGGGMVSLFATDTLTLTISARIYCNGTNGNAGGNGGGESTDNTYDCSSSGYDACTICSESVYDAAGGAGGGSGGGSGGGIRIKSPGVVKLKSGALLQTNGGNGGLKGYPNSSVGTCFDDAAPGGGGSGGRVKVITTCNPANEFDMSYQTNGGTGYQTGGVGTFNIITILPEDADTITGPDTVCAGEQVTYATPAVSNAETYVWNVPTGATILNGANTNTITVVWDSTSTSGLVSVTPHNGCGDGLMAILNVIVKPLPIVVMNPASPTVCYSTEATLAASCIQGYTYQWQEDISCNGSWVNIPGADSCIFQTMPLNESVCYRVVVTNSCATINANTVHITVNPIPTAPVIDYLNLTTLTSNYTTGNQWFNSQGMIPGANGQTYIIPQNDNYYAVYYDSFGCPSDPSNVISFTVGTEYMADNGITVYPNPAHNVLNIVGSNSNNTPCDIVLSDVYGRVVYKASDCLKNNFKINLTNVSSGTYLLKINNNEINYLTRIVITK